MSPLRALSLLAVAVGSGCGGNVASHGGDDGGSSEASFDAPSGPLQDAGAAADDGPGVALDAFPVCFPDLVLCGSADQCCSHACVDQSCGAASDAALPSTCLSAGSTACDGCLAMACCPPLGGCQQDATCSQALQCFRHCDAPGQEMGCLEMCMQGLQTPVGKSLVSCMATRCGTPCQ
jgi:hypothetical protein